MPAAAAFVAPQSRPVASALMPPLRPSRLPVREVRRVGSMRILDRAQKLGLGAFVLLMGGTLLAMRPHPGSGKGQDPRATAAHLKLAAVSTEARRDIDYRLLDARLKQLMAKPAMVGLAVGVVENGRITFLQGY